MNDIFLLINVKYYKIINETKQRKKVQTLYFQKQNFGNNDRILAVLKKILSSPRWQKSQRVRIACLKNPRLPLSFVRKLLQRCDKHQLRRITKSAVVSKKIRPILQKKKHTILCNRIAVNSAKLRDSHESRGTSFERESGRDQADSRNNELNLSFFFSKIKIH